MTGSFGNMTGTLHDDYQKEVERYDKISEFFMNLIPTSATVYIEDYSFGSKGRVFNLAENCGLLKYKLWERKVDFITVPPTVIKKFATGKGNANKEKMYEAFVNRTGMNLIEIVTPFKKIENPLTDIVDAYFIALYGEALNSLTAT